MSKEESMELRQAMAHALRANAHTRTDPFLLHSHVSDLVGNDYEAKKAAEEFYRLDAKYEISKTILGSAPVRYKKRKKHYYKVKPMPIPPDNAYVYFDEDAEVLHLSGECPCLKGASQIYRATYDHARKLDFKRKHISGYSWFYKAHNFGSITRLSKSHKVPVCRRCGDFTPKQARGIFHRLGRWILERAHIDLRRKVNYSPTSFERLKARITQKGELDETVSISKS
jgi:hypothetical protein